MLTQMEHEEFDFDVEPNKKFHAHWFRCHPVHPRGSDFFASSEFLKEATAWLRTNYAHGKENDDWRISDYNRYVEVWVFDSNVAMLFKMSFG